ncbi:MAG: hybrid sensor histidine kinase/response regulator [Alphaproteobacteria bacterium]|nr:hybrid sensor histidine kinase/response regulator [Alphaproteobacteria bacterium]
MIGARATDDILPLVEDRESAISRPSRDAEPWLVLVADDDSDVFEVTNLALRDFAFQGRPLKLLPARSAQEALGIFRATPGIALALLDVVMESETAGLDVVREIRDALRDTAVRIVLRTGQPGAAPERVVVESYDINDYQSKAELTADRLRTIVLTCLRSYGHIKQLEDARRALVQLNADLERALVAARAADRAKSAFMATISHELRTPLSAIIGFSEILVADNAPGLAPRETEYVAQILASGRGLLSIVNDVIDFVELETGRVRMERDTIDLGKLVAYVIAQLAPLAKQRSVAVTSLIAPGAGQVFADKRLLGKILGHLLGNAIGYTPKGGSARVEARLGLDGLNRITVADNGVGMTRDEIAKALQPFSKATDGATGAHVGSGIGLNIVHRLVQLHGWRLDIDSAPGQGTVVTVIVDPARAEA